LVPRKYLSRFRQQSSQLLFRFLLCAPKSTLEPFPLTRYRVAAKLYDDGPALITASFRVAGHGITSSYLRLDGRLKIFPARGRVVVDLNFSSIQRRKRK
jgi:hypothetical protein